MLEEYVGLIVGVAIGIIVLILILTNIRIVPQAKAYVIERLGAYHTTWPVSYTHLLHKKKQREVIR